MSLDRREFLERSAAGLLLPLASSLAAAEPSTTKDPKPATPTKPTPAKADPYADAVFVAGEPPLPAKDSFTLAILPDTQNYSEKYPEIFVAQTEWIVANRDKRNIAAVLQLGDITNHNTEPEWKNAVTALSKLDGVVPTFLTLGNHDYSEKGVCKDRTTLFNKYFDIAKIRKTPNFGGVYDKEPEQLENAYYTFAAGGQNSWCSAWSLAHARMSFAGPTACWQSTRSMRRFSTPTYTCTTTRRVTTGPSTRTSKPGILILTRWPKRPTTM